MPAPPITRLATHTGDNYVEQHWVKKRVDGPKYVWFRLDRPFNAWAYKYDAMRSFNRRQHPAVFYTSTGPLGTFHRGNGAKSEMFNPLTRKVIARA